VFEEMGGFVFEAGGAEAEGVVLGDGDEVRVRN
jgi:hypothetical protein